MKLFGIFALAAVAVADFDYDSLGLKKPNKGSDAPAAVDKVILVLIWEGVYRVFHFNYCVPFERT